MIFIVVSCTMEAIGILSVKDDKKVTEISSYRTIRSDHFLLRVQNNLPNIIRQIT